MVNGLVTWIKCKEWRHVLKSKYSEKEFSEPPTGVEPMTFQIPVGRSTHGAMGDLWWARSSTRFLCVTRVLPYCEAQRVEMIKLSLYSHTTFTLCFILLLLFNTISIFYLLWIPFHRFVLGLNEDDERFCRNRFNKLKRFLVFLKFFTCLLLSRPFWIKENNETQLTELFFFSQFQ